MLAASRSTDPTTSATICACPGARLQGPERAARLVVHRKCRLPDLAHRATCKLDRGGNRRAVDAQAARLHHDCGALAGVAGHGLCVGGGVHAGDAPQPPPA